MSLNKSIAVFIFLLINTANAFATHILGGEISLQNISGSRYELQLLLYYDGRGGNDVVEDSILVSSFSKATNQKIDDFIMVRRREYSTPQQSNPSCNEGLNIRIYSYNASIFLEPNIYNDQDGYYLSWQRCCRAGAVSNISASSTTGFVFYMEFPSLDDYPANSSPKFNAISGDYYCVGEQVSIDFSAKDTDGDHLVYSLSTPLAGFSRLDDNVITGMPGPYPLCNGYFEIPTSGQPQIDPDGILILNPTQQGIFIVPVQCDEYRNGAKIGSVSRDIVLMVRDCEENARPEIDFFPYMGSEPYVPGDTVFIRSREDLCHGIKIRDEDLNSNKGESNIVIIDETGGSPANLPELRNSDRPEFNWLACFPDCESPDQNFFKVRFRVTDDHCPVQGSDTVEVNFMIIETEDSPPEIKTDYLQDLHKLGEEIIFNVFVTDRDSSGILISAKGEGFDLNASEMEFDYSMQSCCDAEGRFSWVPECDNLSDLESYKLLFMASGNNCGNTGKDSIEVELFVEESDEQVISDLWMPNVITPNGDGYNDVFRFPHTELNHCLKEKFRDIVIYNRWGREVFSSSDINFSWEANEISAGQYFYRIRIENYSFRGFLHVLK